MKTLKTVFSPFTFMLAGICAYADNPFEQRHRPVNLLGKNIKTEVLISIVNLTEQ